MSSTVMKQLTVQELTKFGFKAEGRYINWSKNLDEKAKIPVVPGRTFQFELYVADSSKEYVNKVLQMIEIADVPYERQNAPKTDVKTETKADIARARKYTPKETMTVATSVIADKPMTRTDWDAKDRRISRQGMLQACLQAVSPMYSDVNALFEAASELADKGLEYVNRT